uniref:G_PROTEIN_RECEP_F1_2 domain-containing protein n=1 Tax=Syphacia muris TaxID=451379 RepID=A0A0N5AJD0_9BILA
MCDYGDDCYTERFWLIGISGSLLAVFGVIANALLTVVFLSNFSYRHSPFFFLGFVALYDTLLDFAYIFLLSVPLCVGLATNLSFCLLWYHYSQPFNLFAQIFKISSVFCLIAASIERYLMTRHWTFTGFEHRTRWFILIIIVVFAVIIKTATCSQLRMLITELTMGKDIMKVRKKNLKCATHTLIVIITAYLISNLLGLILSSVDFFFPGMLQTEHRKLHLISTDVAQVLTVMGNAIRCPAHLFSNSEIRHRFKLMLLGDETKIQVGPEVISRQLSRECQKVEAPWLSLLLIPNDFSLDTKDGVLRRFSANVLLPCSRRPSALSPPEIRRNTYCFGNQLSVKRQDSLDPTDNDCSTTNDVYSDDSVEILL